MLASFPKVPKTQRPKSMKIDVFDYPTVVLRPLSRETLRISAQSLCCQKLESMAYIFAANGIGLSSFNFLWWAPKDASFLEQNAYRPLKFIQGRWFWHQSKGRMRVPIVINSNYGPLLRRFWDTASYWLKIANFSYPTLVWRPRSGDPVRISGWNLQLKN